MFLVLVIFSNFLDLSEKIQNLTLTNTDASDAKPIQPSSITLTEEVKNSDDSAHILLLDLPPKNHASYLSDQKRNKCKDKLKFSLKRKIQYLYLYSSVKIAGEYIIFIFVSNLSHTKIHK